MAKILHLLRSEPDEVITDLIAALDGHHETRVICLYPDAICIDALNWNRLIEDIMAHDTTICWW